ncbi:hypothetical protein M4951_04780 [Blastopirellula sp. J2-11]|uniref:hypothetical protein n=1 Tax=Blastopirellula sp. J2-11 TaxID=2943192 RepID=UPI0021C93E0A|nr:hypothetical protein [Blastopirellula sp. J2-11]UUO07624.1 hypothetical protein M4951_04780 [Blastopirellula sp. J2-11]
MSEQSYMVSGYEPEGSEGTVVFTFVPKGEKRGTASGDILSRPPQFVVAVHVSDGSINLDWGGSPDDPGVAKDEIQKEVQIRMQERTLWIDRVRSLVDNVNIWAQSKGWSTRRVEKKLDDARVGAHHVPALVMQADTVRIMLEPIGRSAPGVEGIADLYLMPGYDDIASIFYYDGGWKLHYAFSGKIVTSIREAEAIPLSEDSLKKILEEMRQHAL